MTLSIGKEKVGDGTEIIEMLIKKGYFDNVKGIVEYAEAFKNF